MAAVKAAASSGGASCRAPLQVASPQASVYLLKRLGITDETPQLLVILPLKLLWQI